MFYSEFVLAKKGALGKIWLAAHWEKKLTRNQISKSNIVEACNSIIKPVAPLALRTSGHLLLGVVRIHDGKQKSLMHDCSDALVKIKLAFRPGNVDLPANRVSANYNSITGAEDLDGKFEDEFPAVEDHSALGETQLNVGTVEQITMQEFDPIAHDAIPAPEMDGFGDEIPVANDDFQAEEIEMGRDAIVEDDPYNPNDLTMDQSNAEFSNSIDQSIDVSAIPEDDNGTRPPVDDGFGDEIPADPNESTFGINDSTMIPEMEDEISVLNQTSGYDDAPLEPLRVQKQNKSTLKLSRKKRKLVVDDKSVEIPSSVIKSNLEATGCDEILKQPYSSEDRQSFFFKRAPYSRKGMQGKLAATSAEALFNAPVSFGGNLTSPLLKLWNKNKSFQPTDEMLASPDTVEVGRRNLDVSNDVPDLPDQTFEEEAPVPTDEPVEFEAPLMDDSLDNSMAQSRLDDDSVNQSHFDSTMFNESREDTDGDTLVTASQYSQQSHLTKRTTKMIENLKAGFENVDEMSFADMTDRKNKRVAAACFFELLVLKTKGYIEVDQQEPYDDIKITPTAQLTASA